MSNYTAIGFDYGGVIYGMSGPVFSAKICDVLGIAVEQYQEVYFRYNKRLNRGEINWQELWELCLKDLGHPEKLSAVLALNQQWEHAGLNPGVLQLVDELRAGGYKTGLLSNNTHEGAALMRDQGIDKHFDAFQVSAETGFVKPELQAFEYLAQQLQVDLTELIFIDDSERSLSTASECGYTPILFTTLKLLRSELQKLAII